MATVEGDEHNDKTSTAATANYDNDCDDCGDDIFFLP